MSKNKKLKRLQVQQDRLKEFEHQEEDHYEERQIGNEWWVKQWNGDSKRWQIAIFSKDSYFRYKGTQKNYSELSEKDNFIKNLWNE